MKLALTVGVLVITCLLLLTDMHIRTAMLAWHTFDAECTQSNGIDNVCHDILATKLAKSFYHMHVKITPN